MGAKWLYDNRLIKSFGFFYLSSMAIGLSPKSANVCVSGTEDGIPNGPKSGEFGAITVWCWGKRSEDRGTEVAAMAA